MFARYWIAPMSLFALQVAPVGVRVDSAGRFSIAFGGGLGTYEETSTDCAGNILDRQKFKHKVVGGAAEAWLTPNIRIAGHAGTMSTTPDPGPQIAAPFEGSFGGLMGAYEGETKGTGLGLSVQPSGGAPKNSDQVVPVFYARLGRLEQVHIRVESGSPAAPGAPPELVRFAIAHGLGHRRQVAWSVGIALASFPDGAALPLNGMLRLPLAQSLDLGLSGGFRYPNGFDFGVFGRVNLGRPVQH